MKRVRKVIELLGVNWQTLAGFEFLYKVMSMSIFTPLFFGIFNGIMGITGYEYLTIENIVPFLINPFTLAALLFLFMCMTLYTMIDIGAVIFLLDQSYQGVRVNLMQTLRYAVHNTFKLLGRKNIMVVFVVLFLIPFLNLGVASGYVSSIAVPEFILDFLKGNWQLLLLFTILIIGLGALLLRWLYAFHYFTLEGCNFKEARRRSAELGRHHRVKDLCVLIGTQVGVYVFYFVLVLAGAALAVFFGGLIARWKMLGIVSASIVWVVVAAFLLIVSALGTPISYACISILFYGHKEERQEEVICQKADDCGQGGGRKFILHIVEGTVFFIAVVCCCFYLYSIYNHKVSIQVEYIRTMEVTAHRGASVCYPENTMAAFRGAEEMEADWIELDVQLSKDGQVFVMHDTNFMRTAGIYRNTWEMDYEEIAGLDVGSFFGDEFAGERVPLLSEVIAFARENGIKLNIEMKPTGHEQAFEEKVIKIIEEEEFQNQCVITSQVYDVLERVKTCNSHIQTVYVMSLAYGDINRLAAADHFSIEAASITEKIVSDVHNEGKEIYAWTVNTEENINRMIDLNVDNIITDDISLARECIYLSKTSDVISEYVKWLLK